MHHIFVLKNGCDTLLLPHPPHISIDAPAVGGLEPPAHYRSAPDCAAIDIAWVGNWSGDSAVIVRRVHCTSGRASCGWASEGASVLSHACERFSRAFYRMAVNDSLR
jgi:hypothetical protein